MKIRYLGIALTLVMTLAIGISTAFAGRYSWIVKKTVKIGQTVQITEMYNIRKCEADKVPPKPNLYGAANFGKLSYRTGKTRPRQCPSIKINANFADYTAGQETGKDKFIIQWVSTGGKAVYTVTYIIKVN